MEGVADGRAHVAAGVTQGGGAVSQTGGAGGQVDQTADRHQHERRSDDAAAGLRLGLLPVPHEHPPDQRQPGRHQDDGPADGGPAEVVEESPGRSEDVAVHGEGGQHASDQQDQTPDVGGLPQQGSDQVGGGARRPRPERGPPAW